MTMKKENIEIPEEISSRLEYKGKFSLLELYRAFVFVPRAMSKLSKNKKNQIVDEQFLERLQLAITEVNGCAACSYQHTKMALQLGMSNDEINSFLVGDTIFVKPEESKAILFAQHFADARGIPKKYAYDAIVKEYGEKEAEIILAACQVMLGGNIIGLPVSAFQSRLKGKTFKGSSILYEIGMVAAGILLLPIAIIHGFIRSLIGLPNKRFDKSSTD